MKKLSEIFKDIFRCIAMGIALSVVISTVIAIICAFIYKGHIVNIVGGIKTVLICIGALGMILVAILLMKKKKEKPMEYINEWKNGLQSGLKGEYQISNNIKAYLFKKYNNKCARCGWGEVNKYTNNIPLEVEHIDGNYQNNKEENLILLCPNCHSLTETYKGANLNHGRKQRKKYS